MITLGDLIDYIRQLEELEMEIERAEDLGNTRDVLRLRKELREMRAWEIKVKP